MARAALRARPAPHQLAPPNPPHPKFSPVEAIPASPITKTASPSCHVTARSSRFAPVSDAQIALSAPLTCANAPSLSQRQRRARFGDERSRAWPARPPSHRRDGNEIAPARHPVPEVGTLGVGDANVVAAIPRASIKEDGTRAPSTMRLMCARTPPSGMISRRFGAAGAAPRRPRWQTPPKASRFVHFPAPRSSTSSRLAIDAPVKPAQTTV